MGLFVTFEGGDGAGKTTQVRLLAEWLRERGHGVVETREPGGTELGRHIRRLLLHGGEVSPRAEALLYAADRAHDVATVIRPALDRGDVVVADRYVDSSVAYQGAARSLGKDEVRELSMWATESLIPDLTVFLDLPTGTSPGAWGAPPTGSRPPGRSSTRPSAANTEPSPRPNPNGGSSSTLGRASTRSPGSSASAWPPGCSAAKRRPEGGGRRDERLRRSRRPGGRPRTARTRGHRGARPRRTNDGRRNGPRLGHEPGLAHHRPPGPRGVRWQLGAFAGRAPVHRVPHPGAGGAEPAAP